MTKAQFIEQVAGDAGAKKKDVEVLLEATFATVGKTILEEGRFAWPGFGTFKLQRRAARKGRNPQTGKTMAIKESRTVGFKPAPALKGSL